MTPITHFQPEPSILLLLPPPLDRELKFVLSKYFQGIPDDGFGTELKMSVVKSLLRELERKNVG